MSRALDFQIRYGNADELDNYDPMADVYNNQAFIGGIQHLIFSKPTYDETTNQTKLLDELGNDRERIGNNCILGNGVITIDMSDGVSGTLSVSGWKNSGAGWSYQSLTSELSTTTFTAASGAYYKNLERYDNRTLLDVFMCEETTGQALISTEGNGAFISASGLRTTQDKAPLIEYSSDFIGYNLEPVLYDSQSWSNGGQVGSNRNHRLPIDNSAIDTAIYYDQNNPSGGFDDWDTSYTASGLELNPSATLGANSRFYLFLNYSIPPISTIKKGSLVRVTFDIYLPTGSNWDRARVDIKDNSLVYRNDFYFFPSASVQTIEHIVIWGANGTDTDMVLQVWALAGYNPASDETAHVKNVNYKILNTYVPSKDGVTDALFGYDNTVTGRKKFNSYRVENKAAYFDTNSYLTPVSGTISGFAIDETWGSAAFTMSGNNIACSASGSCNGIKLDNGNWYTFSEGIFGDASGYIYDVSGSGIHLQINGQTAAQTWQQSTGLTDYGYDWRDLYGGHRYRLVDVADDIFIPHVVNTQDVPTESLLPSGYTLLSDIQSGKHVSNNATYLLASGLIGEYNGYSIDRTELDAHQMNVTAFTESKGNYIRQTSSRWDQIVITPDNLSEAANTLVDFNASDISSIVGLTFQVTDIQGLNQLNASYSKKFRLPATQRNNDLFDYVYDPNNADFSTLKEPKDAEIISNGIEILRGKGQIERTFKQDIATGYDMTVIGDNYNVYTALDDIQVSGIGFGTFDYTQAAVETSWNYTATSGNVTFAPIDYGNKNLDSFDLVDLTPSFFVRNILASGLAQAGIGYESAWLDSDYAKRLVIPFNGIWSLGDTDYTTVSGGAYFLAEESSISITASGATTKQYIDITETTSNPNYTNTGAIYVANTPSKSKYTFEFDALNFSDSRLEGSRNFAVAQVTVGIEINGSDVVETKVKNSSFAVITSNIITKGADIVRPYIKTAYDFDMTNVTFKSFVSHDIAEGHTLTLADYVPIKKDGLTVFDVFKGLADAFNIVAYYDPFGKVLKFEPYADFYSGELDWSTKWNQTQEAQAFYLGDTLNREIQHKFKDDKSDYWLTRYEDGYEQAEPYASYLYTLPRNYVKGRKVFENSIFAPTTDYEYSTFGVTIPNIRWNTKDGTQFSGGRGGQIPELRLLYFEGKNNTGTFKMNVDSGVSYSVQSYAYTPRLAFRARSGESWQSLAYDSFNSKKGLFATYFEPKYRNIVNGITSIYWLNLTEKDIALRPLDKKIYLDGAWWLINKIIDFNPLNDDPTQVELIKLVNYTFNIAENTTPWIDIITGKKFDPISHKPNNDLPTNAGFSVSAASGYNISPIDDDYYGTSQGNNNLAPRKGNTSLFGHDLTTYWSDQFITGQFNSPNENDVFQVGGGTSASGRSNAFAVRASGGEYALIVEDSGRVVDDRWHLTTSGVKRSSYKTFTGSGTTAGDGTLTVYPTFDATSSGIAIFNEITFVDAMVVESGAGSRHIKIKNYSTTSIEFEVNPSSAQSIIYKIEGN